jgi:hypothetical protein
MTVIGFIIIDPVTLCPEIAGNRKGNGTDNRNIPESDP